MLATHSTALHGKKKCCRIFGGALTIPSTVRGSKGDGGELRDFGETHTLGDTPMTHGAGGGRGCRGDTHPEPPPPAASTESGVMARVSPNRRRRGKSANGKPPPLPSALPPALALRGARTRAGPRGRARPRTTTAAALRAAGARLRGARRAAASPLLFSAHRRAALPLPFARPALKSPPGSGLARHFLYGRMERAGAAADRRPPARARRRL